MGVLSPFLKKWRIKKVSKWIAGKRILDCGCDDGSLLNVIDETAEYVGVDIKEVRSKITRKKNVKFLVLDFEKDELRVKKFDSIVVCALIEHLKDPKKFLSNITNLLARDGRIIITTPVPEASKILDFGSAAGIFDRAAFEDHKNYMTYEDFEAAAKELGLRMEHYERFELGLNQLIVLSNK
jgi:SAM-dependent methyltransferase